MTREIGRRGLFAPSFGRRRILWMNLSGSFVVGLDRLCPIEAVACLDDGEEFEAITARSGVKFLSRERRTGRRIRTPDPCMEDIVPTQGSAIEDVLRGDGSGDWLIVCPRGARSLEVFARERGVHAVCPPGALYASLNHKAGFFAGLRNLGLPCMPGWWVRAGGVDLEATRRRLGTPFVLQAGLGQSGSGTFLIRDVSDLDRAFGLLGDVDVWLAPYAGRLSLNVNAIAMASRTVVGYPSVQLVGLGLVGARPFSGYCGNDFTSTAGLPSGIVSEAQEQAERIGRWLAAQGFRGLFGIDFVVDADRGDLWAVDLNPRWQGSTALETQAALQVGRVPLAAAELAYVTGAIGESEIVSMIDDFRAPLEGAQLFLHHVGAGEVVIEPRVRPGVYAAADRVEFRRAGLDLSACHSGEEWLVCGGVVRPGTRITPGARPARIVSRGAMVDPETLEPLPWARRAVGAVYQMFGLVAPDGETGGA